MPTTTPYRGLRWVSLLVGSLVLLFILWMLIGHLVGDANGPDGMPFKDTKEVITFVLFPVCNIIGLALAYKWPLLGGGIAVASNCLLFALRPDLLFSPFLAILVPGLLYVGHGWLTRKRTV